jgi:adenosylcobyric acid synthase
VKKLAPCISFLGTASDVGKSVVATAFCRIFSDMGVSVAPFKAQNMSNNSFVVNAHNGEWGEMGRAQVAQAEAARVTPHVDMNPVLLKPVTNVGAQVVVLGKALGESSATEYGNRTTQLKQTAIDSLNRLRGEHDLIIMEGAGSCAEINLRERDFVNFEVVKASNASVVLVADIDRGGVFAQVIGTLDLLSPEERKHVGGIIINRFRGDVALFQDGIRFIEERSKIPVLGVIPYMTDIGIDGEDAVMLDTANLKSIASAPAAVHVAAVHLPHISNFTDVAPLEKRPGVRVTWIKSAVSLEGVDAVILPGTKNVRGDLAWLRNVGLDRTLSRYIEQGGRVVGICGGYQILGRKVHDPSGVEGDAGTAYGLGYLDAVTTLSSEKMLRQRKGIWLSSGVEVSGYEIHHGETRLGPSLSPLIQFSQSSELDGAMDASGRIWGTYLHGIFDSPDFLRDFLKVLAPDAQNDELHEIPTDAALLREQAYDRLAATVLESVDMTLLLELAK